MTFSTRRVCLGIVAFVAIVSVSFPGQPVVAQDDPEQLLEQAATVMLDLESFHFVVSTPVGKTTLFEGIELAGIEGDVVRPATFQTEFTVSFPFFSIGLEAIGDGNRLWVADPLSGGDELILVAENDSEFSIPPEAILNPDQLVLHAISLLDEPVLVGEEPIDGLDTVRIDGVFDPGRFVGNGTPIAALGIGTFEPIDVSIWLDEDQRVVRVEFAGALLPTDEPDVEVVRRIDLSAFNEPIDIEIPDGD